MNFAKAPSVNCVCPIPSPIQLCPCPNGRQRASLGYARNAAAAGPGRRKGQPAAQRVGRKKGVCCQLGRGPPLLSPPTAQVPLSLGSTGGQMAEVELFQRQPQLRSSKLGLCFSSEGANEGREGSSCVPVAPPMTTAKSQGYCLKKCPPKL